MGVNEVGDTISPTSLDFDSLSHIGSLSSLISYVLGVNVAQSDLATGKIVDYARVRAALQAQLDSYVVSADESDEYPPDSGRLGPRDVCMAACGSGGLLCGRRLESTSNFGSAIANVGVVKGKWMYEVTLWTGGIQQLGWATLLCPFTNEEGVGDTRDSYAFDGKRVRKWNKRAVPYGKAWTAGDVVGACIDLDSQEVSFHLNGEPLGVAFKDVRLFQAHLAYFPAVSLSLGESCSVNLGAMPFRYPVEGFQPLQKPPAAHVTLQCSYLLQCMERLVEVELHSRSRDDADEKAAASAGDDARRAEPVSSPSSPRLRGTDHMLLASCFAERLGELLADEYAVEAALLPFLLRLHGRSEFHNVAKLQRVLALLHAVLEDHELHSAMRVVLGCLGARSATASLQSQQLPYSGSYPYVALAAVLVSNAQIARAWVTSPTFHEHLEQLLTIKQPSQRDLEALLPQVWWPGCPPSLAQNEVAMSNKVSLLRAAMNKVEERHMALVRCLCVIPGAGVPGCSRSQSAPPQSAFSVFCSHVARKNVGVTRQIQPHGLSDNSVLVSTFYAVLAMLGPCMLPVPAAPAAAPPAGAAAPAASTTGAAFASDAPKGRAVGAAATAHAGATQPSEPSAPVAARAAVERDALMAGSSDAGTETLSVTHRGSSSADSMLADGLQGLAAAAARGPRPRTIPVNTLRQFPAAELFVPRWQDEPDPYLGFNRVGGVLGEVLKSKLEQWEHADIDMTAWLPLIQSASYRPEREVSLEELEQTAAQAHRLLDTAMMLYVVGLHVTYKWTSHHAHSLNGSLAALAKMTKRLQEVGPQTSPSALAKLKSDEQTLIDSAVENVRLSAWLHKVYVHGGWRRQACINLVTYLAHLLSELHTRPHLWSHVPEAYVECTLASFHALQRSAPSPGEPLPASTVHAVVRMLVKLLNDKRVVSPYMKEIMLSSVNMLFSQPTYLRMIEAQPLAVEHLLPSILGAYTQELWMPLSTILMRLIEGTGFGYAQDKAKGSQLLRERLAALCLLRTPESTKFVNQLFSSLNWAITELTMTLRDLDSMQGSLQRRLHVLFEFAVNSCRLLEFLFMAAPLLFLSGPPINASRLCEMLAFVISHIDAKDGSQALRQLSAILDSDSAKLHPLHLLAPVVSILMLAWQLEFGDELQGAALEHSIVRMLGNMKEACSTERLAALADCDWSKLFGDNWRQNMPEDLRYCYPDFLAYVKQWRASGGDAQENVPDEFLDPIMMCVMEDPVILPDSKVTVDRSTIVRHLLGSETDPFSRAPLVLQDVLPNVELKRKLQEWRAASASGAGDTDVAAGDDGTTPAAPEPEPVSDAPNLSPGVPGGVSR